MVLHDEELLAASDKARLELLAMKADVQANFAAGWSVQVKGPFAMDGGGNEWMWVEVLSWQGEHDEALAALGHLDSVLGGDLSRPPALLLHKAPKVRGVVNLRHRLVGLLPHGQEYASISHIAALAMR